MTISQRTFVYFFLNTTLLVFGCGSADSESFTSENPDPTLPHQEQLSGSFTVLTYNVAGLPLDATDLRPDLSAPLIGTRLNGFDLVFLQEDFSYHDSITAETTFPFQSTPDEIHNGYELNDGLNFFSNFSFTDFQRIGWQTCNGVFEDKNDCLADKGFSVATFSINSEIQIDIYNIHLDSGRELEDIQARQAQLSQLKAFIERRPQRAFLLAGDTNLKKNDESDFLNFLYQLELQDSCRDTRCAYPFIYDKVMLHSSPNLKLSPQHWGIRSEFVDPTGQTLSDHPAIAVEITWQTD